MSLNQSFQGYGILFSVLVVLTCTPVAQADEEGRGSWAAQFRVTDNFTLSSFNGSVFSLKKHLTARNALRGSMDLSLSHSARTTTNAVGLVTDDETDAKVVGLGVEYLRYFTPASRFSLFLGAGPFFRIGDGTSKRSDNQGSPDSIAETNETSYGVRGILGVEWFVTSRIGLHSEYGVDASHFSAESSLQPSGITSKTDGWRLDDRAAFLGASVYF